MKYRAEIDGLRALAVLPVIFFHAGFELFKGGFIGVDVFFVISGYLITSILLIEMDQKNFSLTNFYERRARRILPALVFTVVITSLFAPFILLPDQIKDLGQTIVSISAFLANYFFYLEIDYFNEFSSKNPLLHTWSLAVEEQFYLIFPILLLAIPQKNFKTLFIIFITILTISFYAASTLSSTNMSLSFYSIHTRAWELLFGSVAAVLLTFKKDTIEDLKKNKKHLINTLIAFSMMLLVASFCLFNEEINHPGLLTIIPVFSTFLLILFMQENDSLGKWLSSRPVVKIGLISYSLYLIHNPIFSYIDIYFESYSEDVLTLYKISTIPLIFALSYASYIFVEKPFRNKSMFGRKKIFILSAASLSALFAIGLFTHFKNGFIDEITDYDKRNGIVSYIDVNYEKKKISEISNKFSNNSNNFSCSSSNCNEILIIGDSFAQDIFLSLSNEPLERKVNLIPFDDSCMSRINNLRKYGELKCDEKIIKEEDFNLMIENAKKILISAKWQEQTYKNVLDLSEYIQQKSNARLYAVGSILFANIQTLHKRNKNSLSKPKDTNFYNYVRWDRVNISNKLRNIVDNEKNIDWIEKSEFFCDLDQKSCTLFDEDNDPLIWDNAHITAKAYEPFSKFILNKLH